MTRSNKARSQQKQTYKSDNNVHTTINETAKTCRLSTKITQINNHKQNKL